MTSLTFRSAEKTDLPAIVALLADDDLGKSRENKAAEAMPRYERAFDRIKAQGSGCDLIVGLIGERIVGMLLFSVLPGLSFQGTTRAQVEEVRVASDLRSKGIGTKLMAHAEQKAKEAGCGVIQLTSNRARTRAHRFYERKGYVASHYGFKKAVQ